MNEQQIRTLAAYIPGDRRRALAQGEGLPDRTTGAALFADISGFTRLTHAFIAERGQQRGAEALLSVINPVFDALIAPLHRYGGSVISFAGDAITCWFDEADGAASARAVTVALAMQEAMNAFGKVYTPDGTPVSLSLKVAVAAGSARRFLVGDPEIMVIDTLAGATLAWMGAAEKRARRGEIVVSAEAAAALGDGLQTAGSRDTFAVVEAFTQPVSPLPRPAAMPDESQLRAWVLPAIYDDICSGAAEVGSLRPVTPLFLKFSGIDFDGDDQAGAKLDRFVRRMQQIVHRYGGSLLQLIIGDKGAYIYAVFGAPVAHEDDSTRALRAALAIRHLPAELDYIDSVQMGLTRGDLWAGNCGAAVRRSYAVMGFDVNLSARLMGRAKPGQILVSMRVATASGFKFTHLGDWQYKGFADLLPTYELNGEQLAGESDFTDKMVGREAELAQLLDWTRPLFQHKSGGALIIYGDAGMGKSRLSHTLRQTLGERVSWFTGQTDAVLRQAFNPFIYWLKRYFNQSPEATDEENKRRFAARFDRLLDRLYTRNLADADNCRSTQLQSELIRTRSLLGAMIGLHWPDSLYERLDAKLRYQNSMFAVRNLLLTESCRRPVVFELEDAHWLDEASHDLLAAISRDTADFPLMLLITSRYADDGGKPDFTFAPDMQGASIELGALSRIGLRRQAENILNNPINGALLNLLEERTGANPFFAQQMLYYFRENELLAQDENGIWGLKTAVTDSIPAGINAILIARIDRLTQNVKNVVASASVLGREFDDRVLAWMLQADVTPEIAEAAREQIWDMAE